MRLSIYIHRIKFLDKSIRSGRTGPPEELARQLGLSPSTLYQYLHAMRTAGAPIVYSKQLKSYFYLYPVEFAYGFRLPNPPPAPQPGEGAENYPPAVD